MRWLRRPIDIRDTVDWLFDSLSATGGDLNGCVDPDDDCTHGHSFGGYATLATAGAVVDFWPWVQNPMNDVRFRIGLDRTRHEAQRIDLSDERVWAAMPMAHAGHEVLHGGLDQPISLLSSAAVKTPEQPWNTNPTHL